MQAAASADGTGMVEHGGNTPDNTQPVDNSGIDIPAESKDHMIGVLSHRQQRRRMAWLCTTAARPSTASKPNYCYLQTLDAITAVTQAAALADGSGMVIHGGNAPDNSRLGDLWLLQRT